MFDWTFVVHAAAEGEAVNPLSFDLWTFLFQLINVAVVLVALYYMLFRPGEHDPGSGGEGGPDPG